jgi:hypothetical protein
VSLTAPAPTTGSVPVSINGPTHPEHHPGPHAGMALGFPMTVHEVGAALAVAVLSAVAASAGSLSSPAGGRRRVSGGFVAAAGIAATVAVVSFGCGRRTCGQRSDSVRTAPPVTVEPPQPPRETP